MSSVDKGSGHYVAEFGHPFFNVFDFGQLPGQFCGDFIGMPPKIEQTENRRPLPDGALPHCKPAIGRGIAAPDPPLVSPPDKRR